MPFPSLRTMSRVAGALSVVVAVAAALLTFVMPSVGALPQERIILTVDEIKEVTFPGIAGNNPANDLHTPEQCNISAYCDTIPVTFVRPPNFDDTQDYFVQFLLSWETQKVPDALEPSGERAVNDLDMFIYNDPIQEDAGPDQDGVIASGASGGEPEVAYLFTPEGDYSVVVVNFAGVNSSYTLKLTWVSETITTPFESLAPTFTPRTPASSAPSSQTSPGPAIDTGAPTPPAPASLDPLPVEPDLAYESGFENSDFEEALAAPSLVDYLRTDAVEPAAPSGIALVLWMLVLPLAGTAVGGAYLARRSAHRLQI